VANEPNGILVGRRPNHGIVQVSRDPIRALAQDGLGQGALAHLAGTVDDHHPRVLEGVADQISGSSGVRSRRLGAPAE
jgi:hypothetical protein